MSNGGEYLYSIGLDTKSLAHGVEKAKKMFKGLGDTAKEAGAEADEAIENLKSSLASLAAGVSLSMFAKKMAEVRGEVQQLEVAFETMLGSKERADQLIAEVTELAAKTPFGLEDVSSATKMLLAFGSTAEEVAGEITMLGDIASGLSIPLNDMIFLYGSTRTQGQMFTQDLRQFMSRGIPLADELAKIFGVTKAEVSELVSKGEVGFEQMAQALSNMTSEGGQFAGLMEKQSQTIAGQMSAIGDAIYQMFNELGEKNEGLIGSVLSGTTWAIENYEKLLKVIVPVIAAYGAYKAALIATAAIQKASTIIASTKAFFELAKSVKSAKDAMLLFNMATGLNPLSAILAGIAALVTVFTMMGDETEELTDKTNEYMQARDDAIAKEDEHKRKMEELASVAGDEAESTEDRRRALVALEMQYPNIFAQYDTEIDKLNNIKRIKEEIAAYEGKKSIANPEVELKDVEKQIDAMARKYKEIYSEAFEIGVIRNLHSDEDWEKIKQLQQRQKELYAELFKIDVQDTISKADTLSDDAVEETLEKLKTERSRRNRIATGAGRYDRMDILPGELLISDLTTDSEFASWSNDFIQAYIQSLEGVKAERAKPNLSAKQRVEAAAKAWVDAEKEYEDFLASKTAMSEKEYQEKLKQLDEARKKAKTEAEAAGVSTTKSGATGGAGKNKKTAADDKQRKLEQAGEMERQLAQQNIDDETALMEEGVEKKLKQIDDEYAKRMAAITKNEAELRKLQGGKLTEAQQAEIEKSRQLADQKRKADRNATLDESMKAELLAMDEYLIKFGTLQEKIRATKSKYERDIAEALTEGERMTLEAERDALLAEYQVAASDWAKELTDKTVVELSKMLAELEAEVKAKNEAFQALDSVDEATRQDYLDTINKLNAQIAILKTKLGEANKAVSDNNWAEATQVFQSIASSASEAAKGIAGLDENLAYMLSSLADLAGVATNITASIQALGKAIKTVEKASAVLAIIGAAVQAISYIANIFKENTEATQRATDALRAYNAELERINNANISNAYSNIFGKDEYGELNARLKAVREYQTEIDKIYAEADRDKYYGRYKGFEPDDMTLTADMRSGLQKLWGSDKNIKKTSLNEFYNNGVLDVEKLKAYYNAYGEYLDEGEKELVEKLISNGELLQENIDAVTNYLQDKFGSLGGTISDALIDAFKNGTDAAEAMGNAFTDIMEQIAKDMAYSSFIQPLLDEANDKIAKLNEQRKGMSDEEYFEQLMTIGTALMGDAANAQEGYNEFMENLRWYAEQNGMDLFGAGGTPKDTGIARASQESVDELNGRATAIQSHTYSIMQSQQQLVQDTAQVLQYLSHIDENTRGLKVMQKDMASMRKDINTIVTQGISMR